MTSIPVAICRFSENNFKHFSSQKRKGFCQFLIPFLKYALNLEHSKKKEEYPNLIIKEVIASERDVYLSV